MIYQISSGQGPTECELGVAKFLAYLKKHYAISVLETSQGYYENTYRSVRLETEEDLCRISKDKKCRSSCFWNGISLNLLTHGSRPLSSNIPSDRHSESNRHSQAGHYR